MEGREERSDMFPAIGAGDGDGEVLVPGECDRDDVAGGRYGLGWEREGAWEREI